MKHRQGLLILISWSLFGSACGLRGPRATVTEEKEIIKTYPFGDPDPVPILARSRNTAIYPYFRFDGFSREGRDQEWKVVRLENDYIKVYVLPEAGGKIWGAIEKSTGKDFIYKNDVMKFRDVAMRGPWTSGGIEFNFGLIGHTPSTATPVDYLLRENADGSASCVVGGLDLPGRTQWRVEIRLPKDAAEFETRSFWYNPTPLEQPYYHWMNAAVHARADLQFYYPGRYYIGHGGDAHPWPVNENGIDLSLYKNHDFGGNKSLHVLGSSSDFSGGYWHDLGFGFGHWARYDDMPGRKIWIWSLSRAGAIWEDLLTDHSGQYVEVQAGRQFSQAQLSSGADSPFTQAGFPPYTADSWTEVWFPVKQIDGIVAAEPDGALNVSGNGSRRRIGYNALRPIRSDITVTAGGATVLREHLALRPMEVFESEIPVGPEARDIRVMLGNRVIWESGRSKDFVRPVVSPPEKAGSTAEKAFLLGRQSELLRDYPKALQYYGECVRIDPLNMEALVRLAELHYRRAEYGAARGWVDRALAIDTYNPAANFVSGAILEEKGMLAAAREALGWAARSPEYRSASYAMIAETHMMDEHYTDAVEYARRALDSDCRNVAALGAAAVSLRKLGLKMDASRAQAEILAFDPINHLAAAEAYFLAPADRTRSRFVSLIRSELPYETYLELAIFYARLGLAGEAVQILEMSPAHPLVDYWLAYLNRERDPQRSALLLEKATQASPRLVFPYRTETIPVLEWALEHKHHWKSLYYLALIYWGVGREFDALRLMQECGTVPDYGPFYLARAELRRKIGQEPDTADYRRAFDLAPDDWRAWLSLSRRNSELSLFDDAVDVARKGFSKFPDNFILGMEYARALIDARQYQQALDVLDRLVVLPYENASDGRTLFEKAHLLLAGEDIRQKRLDDAAAHIAKSRAWPEHLGAGKPYNPDERLQDLLEAYCHRNRGGEQERVIDAGAIAKLMADLKLSNSWKYELLASLFR